MVGVVTMVHGIQYLHVPIPCAWRIPNRHCRSASPRTLAFSSTLLTLSSHEKYVHGFHFPVGLEFLIQASKGFSLVLRRTIRLPYTPQHENHFSPLCLLLDQLRQTPGTRRHQTSPGRKSSTQATMASALSLPPPSTQSLLYSPSAQGCCALILPPRRMAKVAIGIQPSTHLRFHQWLIRRKYQRLFSPRKRRKPGPKGISKAFIRAKLELKRPNPRIGCPRMALIISRTFEIRIDKHLIRRVLLKHTGPKSSDGGQSSFTFLGYRKDRLRGADLFRGESITLQSHWVFVTMEQFKRRLIGFGVQPEVVDGAGWCQMFNTAIGVKEPQRHLSSAHDPLFTFHRWQANLLILEVKKIKSIPDVPLSHPFIGRAIGTIRPKFLDHLLFWNGGNLKRKLEELQPYYNHYRGHAFLGGHTPAEMKSAELNHFRWKSIVVASSSSHERHN
jgi:putative transposase